MESRSEPHGARDKGRHTQDSPVHSNDKRRVECPKGLRPREWCSSVTRDAFVLCTIPLEAGVVSSTPLSAGRVVSTVGSGG